MAIDPAFAFTGERTFTVGELAAPVTVRIYRRPDGGYHIEPSHFLKTAIQYLPHAYRGPFAGTEDEAVQQLVAAIDGFYQQAVRRGYPPSESWLVPNTDFKDA
jgi:hypothetical protein